MNLIALETTTELGSCALLAHGRLIERFCPPKQPHAESLLPLVREMMAEAGLAFGELDGIAFGCGPGAFTGLRVACGVAQGFAVAAGVPVTPVSSLEAMAFQVDAPHVLSLLDARMGEVYFGQVRRAGGGLHLLDGIRVGAPEAVSLPLEGEWVACGNAPTVYPVLAERLAQAGIVYREGVLPTASAVAQIAAARPEAAIDAALAAPLYIRDKVAKTIAERLLEGGKA